MLFYRIKNDSLYDYADYKYTKYCSETDIITMEDLGKYPNKVIIVEGRLELNPEFDKEQLIKEKKDKAQEALVKANEFISNGEALFEFEEGKHIEATDGNIGKFTAYLIGFEKGLYEKVLWNTKEDENIELNAEQVATILQGLAMVQSGIWTYKYPYFLKLIEEAKTVEEVQAIEIDYTLSAPEEEPTEEVSEEPTEEVSEEPTEEVSE